MKAIALCVVFLCDRVSLVLQGFLQAIQQVLGEANSPWDAR